MARWKNVGGDLKWRNNSGILMTALGDKDAGQPMLGWTEDQEDDYYIRPGLRHPIGRKKKRCCRLAIMSLAAFILLAITGTCIIVFTSKHYVIALLQKPCAVCDSVESAMNLSVDPCQDFYEYTCGNWVANVKVPKGYSKWGAYQEVYNKNKDLLLKLLAEDGYEYNGNHSEALRKAKDYYHACMNVTAIEQAGSAPLKQLLNQLGGWSILPRNTPGIVDWDETSFDLTQAVTSVHLLNGSPLYQVGIIPDDKNTSVNIITFVQDGIGFNPINQFHSDNVRTRDEAYATLGAKVVVLLSLTDDESVVLDNITSHSSYVPALERMRKIVYFEADIRRKFMPTNRDPAKAYKKVTVEEFASIIPQINMSYYLNEIFATTIPLERKILVPTFNYFVNLNYLLKRTDKRILADYLTWNAVKPKLEFLPKIYEDIVLEYRSVLTGPNTASIPLLQKCLQRTDETFPYVTGALFVREVVTPQLINETQDLIHYIQDAFIGNLHNVTWMDDATKEAAEEKAYAIKRKIGFPDWIEDTVQLDAYFKDIDISASSVFQNSLNVVRYLLQKLRGLLDEPVDKNEWPARPTQVNAFYIPQFNEMVFPSGILQAPFYDVPRPMSMNFGAIGMVMGHELTHGFDNHGREFDKDGNLRDWWGRASALAYTKRTDCLVNQYYSYKMEILGYLRQVDGVRTLGENIADNGGLKLAYQAYHKWRETFNDTMGLLSGLGLSHDQLFFVGFGQVWCTHATPQYTEMSILADTHSPEKFRVNGAVSNMPVFADVFNCPSGTPMNPRKKCEVW